MVFYARQHFVWVVYCTKSGGVLCPPTLCLSCVYYCTLQCVVFGVVKSASKCDCEVIRNLATRDDRCMRVIYTCPEQPWVALCKVCVLGGVGCGGGRARY